MLTVNIDYLQSCVAMKKISCERFSLSRLFAWWHSAWPQYATILNARNAKTPVPFQCNKFSIMSRYILWLPSTHNICMTARGIFIDVGAVSGPGSMKQTPLSELQIPCTGNAYEYLI